MTHIIAMREFVKISTELNIYLYFKNKIKRLRNYIFRMRSKMDF